MVYKWTKDNFTNSGIQKVKKCLSLHGKYVENKFLVIFATN